MMHEIFGDSILNSFIFIIKCAVSVIHKNSWKGLYMEAMYFCQVLLKKAP